MQNKNKVPKCSKQNTNIQDYKYYKEKMWEN